MDFKCKGCARCCKELKLEIVELDLIREPKLKMFAEPLAGEWDVNNPFDKAYALPSPCPFLKDNKCSIHPTRPNICVAFSDKCLNTTLDAKKIYKKIKKSRKMDKKELNFFADAEDC